MKVFERVMTGLARGEMYIPYTSMFREYDESNKTLEYGMLLNMRGEFKARKKKNVVSSCIFCMEAFGYD